MAMILFGDGGREEEKAVGEAASPGLGDCMQRWGQSQGGIPVSGLFTASELPFLFIVLCTPLGVRTTSSGAYCATLGFQLDCKPAQCGSDSSEQKSFSST